MPRSVKEWIGKTDDTPVPPRVRLRVLERFHFRCDADSHGCGRLIAAAAKWCCDHIDALVNGGENREKNLHPLCAWCTPEKDKKDVAIKSATYKRRKLHYGVRGKKYRWACGTDTPFKKTIGGKAVRR
jgi:hypothetical protein